MMDLQTILLSEKLGWNEDLPFQPGCTEFISLTIEHQHEEIQDVIGNGSLVSFFLKQIFSLTARAT